MISNWKSKRIYNGRTNLVLLAAVAEARLPEIVHHGLATANIFIKVGDVVELAFQGLASGIFSFTRNLANALSGFKDGANVVARWTRGVARVRLPV
jgi:hypothetical protein